MSNRILLLDKNSSVTTNLHLEHKVEVSSDIILEHGAILAVEVLHDKSLYNTLELPSGRMSRLKKHDIISVALGNRMALKGFTGGLPKSLGMYDEIHLLNQGGVAGECFSSNHTEVGEPLRIKVLGTIMRRGKHLNVSQGKIFEQCRTLKSSPPLIVISGTGMDSGKTTVAAELIKQLRHFGLSLAAAKLTGVSLLRDTYKMQDFGVRYTASFLDAGIASTANLPDETIVGIAKGAVCHLAKNNPDVIIIEFGDGIFGKYGVRAVLADGDIQKHTKLHVGCASEPAGAVKLFEECARIGLPLDIMSGPVTDNLVGESIIKEYVGIPSFNAFNPNSETIVRVLSKWNTK